MHARGQFHDDPPNRKYRIEKNGALAVLEPYSQRKIFGHGWNENGSALFGTVSDNDV